MPRLSVRAASPAPFERAQPVVLDVFPPCPDCGWSGYPRYRWLSDQFDVKPSKTRGPGLFYVTQTRCSNCDAHYRMFRPVASPNWQHDVKVAASA